MLLSFRQLVTFHRVKIIMSRHWNKCRAVAIGYGKEWPFDTG